MESYDRIIILSFGNDLVTTQSKAIPETQWVAKWKALKTVLSKLASVLENRSYVIVFGLDPRKFNMSEPEITDDRVWSLLSHARQIGLNARDAKLWLDHTHRDDWNHFHLKNHGFAVQWMRCRLLNELRLLEVDAKGSGRSSGSSHIPTSCRINNLYFEKDLSPSGIMTHESEAACCIVTKNYNWTMQLDGENKYRILNAAGHPLVALDSADGDDDHYVVIESKSGAGRNALWTIIPTGWDNLYQIRNEAVDGRLMASMKNLFNSDMQQIYIKKTAPYFKGQDWWQITASPK